MTLNDNAAKIAEEMIGRSEELGVEIITLENNTTLVDCGVRAEGGIEAGRLFSMACLGGMADVWINEGTYGERNLSEVHIETTHPRLACIGSQKAGWRIKVDDFFALGSGPARMLVDTSKQEYKESSDVGVIMLECSILPDQKVARYVAGKCGIREENLIILSTRTASIVGSTQVSARMVETALFKMDALDIEAEVTGASGAAPIAPVSGGDNKMMGVENDMIIYGSKVSLKVKGEIDVSAIPSLSSSEYGVPFHEIFKRAGHDFYNIDQGIFAPAEVTVENMISGATRKAGAVNMQMLEKTLS